MHKTFQLLSKSPVSKFALMASLSTFLLGCNMTPDTSNEKVGSNTTPSSNTAVNSQTATTNDQKTNTNSKCYNEYYPVKDGATLEYKTSGTTNTNYTLKHSKINDEGFAEERDFASGVVVNNNWVCTDEGLRTAEYTNNVSMEKAQMKMDTISSSGITIPKEWSVGKEWDTDFKIKADLNAGPLSTVADGTVKVANKIVSVDEKITAGGKEYQASRVDSKITISLTVKGAKAPGLTVTTRNWYAKGIGLVKQEAGSSLGNQSVEYVGTK